MIINQQPPSSGGGGGGGEASTEWFDVTDSAITLLENCEAIALTDGSNLIVSGQGTGGTAVALADEYAPKIDVVSNNPDGLKVKATASWGSVDAMEGAYDAFHPFAIMFPIA